MARMHKTLIVDDVSVFLETFKSALCERFPTMAVEEATDGRDALQKIEKRKPDLIFMDIRLPGENGIELTERIKKEHPEIIVIILTNYDMPEYRDAALKSGADDYIPKGSLKMSEIEALVERHMAGK
jgi:DNA-binding NarL/FixJ family response regulator